MFFEKEKRYSPNGTRIFRGEFSIYNPIVYKRTHFYNHLCAVVLKDSDSNNEDIILNKDLFNIKNGLGYHGSGFNNNGAMEFTKKQLQHLVDNMKDGDTLHISAPDSLDVEKFKESIKQVVK